MKQIAIAFLLTIHCFLGCKEKKSPAGELTPKESLSGFQLPDGFKIELVVSEPMISDPVAMEVDENGNMFVVEMHGYPLDTTGSGIIKLLKDTNADGAFDNSVVFADHLRLPTGIMKWKKGILVVDVPDILYLEDSNNDGKADIKQVLITGLALTNPQHIANTPLYGLDNWIYVAHMGIVTPKVSMEFNDTGSSVRYADYPGKQLPRNADGRNIRFRLASHELELMSGESQYGQSFDPWGHHLCTSNANHLFHEVIAARYLQRNPSLPVGDAVDYIPDHGDAAEVYPITKDPEHQLLTDVGVITSSCGVTWYSGGLFPDSFQNVTFIAEPVHNLVHADRIKDKGSTFTASRVYHKKEFLASTDPWFRPVQFYIGPDGALYILDYYREIIEHPEWMSDSVNNSGKLYNGSDKGRIYRITPVKAGKMTWCSQLKLGTASTAELVRTLSDNNIWWRRNAQRLLMDKMQPETISLVHQLLDTTNSATATVHALWTLEAFNAMDSVTIRKALLHPVAGVRENAIQIAELHLKQLPRVEDYLLQLQNDPDPKVRYQLLCTLGNINDEQTEMVRQKLLLKDIDDKWVQIAALSSSAGKEYAFIETSSSGEPSESKRSFIRYCAVVIGLSQRTNDIKKLVRLSTTNNTHASDWWQSASLEGLAESIKAGSGIKTVIDKKVFISKFNSTTPPLMRTAAIDLLSLLDIPKSFEWKHAVANAKKVSGDKNTDISYRTDALQLLGLDKDSSSEGLLEKLITPEEPEIVQQKALITYNIVSGKNACKFIVNNWKRLTSNVRDVAMGVLLSSVDNMSRLLDAIQKNQIQPTSISWPRMVSLMNNDDETIRSRSRLILANKTEDRDVVFKKYEPALTIKGASARGLSVFQRVCSTCHQVGNKYGKPFGPDLAPIRNRDPVFIMADILNPNRSIADKYEMWTIVKKHGEKLNGIIASESSVAIILRNIGGQETIIQRSEIKTMEASETSFMPVGLENSISVKEMSDLLAFLKNIH